MQNKKHQRQVAKIRGMQRRKNKRVKLVKNKPVKNPYKRGKRK